MFQGSLHYSVRAYLLSIFVHPYLLPQAQQLQLDQKKALTIFCWSLRLPISYKASADARPCWKLFSGH